MNLESIGATPFVHRAFEPYQAQSLTLARVARAHRDSYHLLTETAELEAEPSGALWHRTPDRAGMPVTGDWVAARVINTTQAIVEAVLPRRTLFSRRAAGRRDDEQPIASNIDVVFLVCGLDGDFNLRRLERYLTLAVASGAEPVVILNKSDLCADLAARMEETRAVAGGAAVVAASALTDEGVTAVRAHLSPGRTIALLGSSGVGKSSIVNALIGDGRMAVSEVRAHDSRGRHTTTHRELILLPGGGALIDTPGMRELQLWAGADSVDAAFDEIGILAEECRYRDCSHMAEAGCAVQEALSNRTLDPARFASYRKLLSEARRNDPAHKKKMKALHRACRDVYKRP